MGFFGMFSPDPTKSIASWGELGMKKQSKKGWQFARENKQIILMHMASSRPGTSPAVLAGIANGTIGSLSELCISILVSEAKRLNPSDIPEMRLRVATFLLQSGIPRDLV